MNYLFLDLSTRSTGWCVSNGKGDIVSYGCIQIDKKFPVEKRINIAKEEIRKILEEFNIGYVVAEDVINVPNTNVYKKLTWLQGNIVTEIYDYNPEIKVEFITSASWRSKIGINVGAGIKRDVLKQKDKEYVLKKYSIDENDDICDSICLKDAYFIKEKNKERESAF